MQIATWQLSSQRHYASKFQLEQDLQTFQTLGHCVSINEGPTIPPHQGRDAIIFFFIMKIGMVLQQDVFRFDTVSKICNK